MWGRACFALGVRSLCLLLLVVVWLAAKVLRRPMKRCTRECLERDVSSRLSGREHHARTDPSSANFATRPADAPHTTLSLDVAARDAAVVRALAVLAGPGLVGGEWSHTAT